MPTLPPAPGFNVTPAQFDAIYWAAQPTPVQKLNSMTTSDLTERMAREDLAAQLARQGYVIDTEVMAFGWGPFDVMHRREQQGWTWYPSLLQPIPRIIPGINMPGIDTYDPQNPPAGSIKVSIDPAVYPAFNPPAAPPAAPPHITNPVGACSIGNIYYNVPGVGNYVNGDQFIDNRGTFHLHVNQGPFGPNVWWEIAAGS